MLITLGSAIAMGLLAGLLTCLASIVSDARISVILLRSLISGLLFGVCGLFLLYLGQTFYHKSMLRVREKIIEEQHTEKKLEEGFDTANPEEEKNDSSSNPIDFAPLSPEVINQESRLQ